jgi:prepilin-type processing-associated H-X9-DG protein
MTVFTNENGTLEFAATGEVFRHFQAVPNELNSAKVLACPNDTQRHRAPDFAIGFGNSNVSYFVGLDANESRPETILTGDRNISGGTMTEESLMFFRTNSLAGWTSEIHSNMGNISLADGSVQQVAAEGLRRQIKAVTNEFIRLAIPVTP